MNQEKLFSYVPVTAGSRRAGRDPEPRCRPRTPVPRTPSRPRTRHPGTPTGRTSTSRRTGRRGTARHTTSTLEAGFSRNKNIKNFVVENVSYINPSTQQRTVYNTKPVTLLDGTSAVTDWGQTVHLTAKSIENPDVVVPVPAAAFTLHGKVDPATYPEFFQHGTVRVFVDRSGTALPATLAPDGSFDTGPTTLNDAQSWYIDRHYVAVNLYDGINMNTYVYQVAIAPQG